jgi:hypothetical protein
VLAATPLAAPFIARQRLVNVFVTNVAGPPAPVRVLDAPVIEIAPIVMPVGNVTMGICAFSYANTVDIVATVDAGMRADVDVLRAAMASTWRSLRGSKPAAGFDRCRSRSSKHVTIGSGVTSTHA